MLSCRASSTRNPIFVGYVNSKSLMETGTCRINRRKKNTSQASLHHPIFGRPLRLPLTDSLSFVFGRMGGANDFHPPQAGKGVDGILLRASLQRGVVRFLLEK
ncbi:hypothetical protein CEXT_192641 [Caerostris extrusa]|uniref:Uncharacterized protein n=1 Tax=Caerostris extrusa TaxID=172846 RepID=A0AAV4SYD5_CAEEX|nr:hypothetical protein CEXT_192641 [Caerostris extrusa]